MKVSDIFKERRLVKEEFDVQATNREAERIITTIKRRFTVPVDSKANRDGSVTITVNDGFHPSEKEALGNANIISVKNFSDVIDKDFKAFRDKGWMFTQPVRGSFSIGVKE